MENRTMNVIELGDVLANDLLTFAQENNITAHDLLVGTAIAERFLQRAVCATSQDALDAILEADATIGAVSTQLESN